MFRIFGCLTEQHDYRLVLLAAIICAATSVRCVRHLFQSGACAGTHAARLAVSDRRMHGERHLGHPLRGDAGLPARHSRRPMTPGLRPAPCSSPSRQRRSGTSFVRADRASRSVSAARSSVSASASCTSRACRRSSLPATSNGTWSSSRRPSSWVPRWHRGRRRRFIGLPACTPSLRARGSSRSLSAPCTSRRWAPRSSSRSDGRRSVGLLGQRADDGARHRGSHGARHRRRARRGAPRSPDEPRQRRAHPRAR